MFAPNTAEKDDKMEKRMVAMSQQLEQLQESAAAIEKRTARTELAINDHAEKMRDLFSRIYGEDGHTSLVGEVEDMLGQFRKELLEQRSQLSATGAQAGPVRDEVALLKQELLLLKSQVKEAKTAAPEKRVERMPPRTSESSGNAAQDPHVLAALNRFDNTIIQMQSKSEEFRLEMLGIAEQWQSVFVSTDKVGQLLQDGLREFRLICEQSVIKSGFLAITCSECTAQQRMTMFDMLLLREKQVQQAQQEASADVAAAMAELDEEHRAKAPAKWPPKECSFLVKLDKSEGKELGLEVEPNRELEVIVVMEVSRGLINQWNQRHPSKQVHPGDYIIGANGISGDFHAVLLELAKQQEQVIAIQKAPDHAKPA